MTDNQQCNAFFAPRLIEAAHLKAGSGDPSSLDTPALRALCESLSDIDNGFNVLGRIRAQQLLIETLVKRLRVEHHLAREPDIRGITLEPPIFLVAPFRTGTTLLHRVLEQDPSHRAPRLWEALQAPPLEPEHRGDSAYFERDYRVAIARRYMQNREKSSGGIAWMHPSGVDMPEECFGLLETSLMSHSFMFYGPVAGYLDWLDKRSDEDWLKVYALYANQIRLLQWWWPGERWILKTPFNMWAVDAILETFPGALIVQQHRSPASCLGSFCSLTAAAYRPIFNQVDKPAIGRMAMRYLGDALARNVAARKRRAADRFIDIDYDDLIRDPITCVRRVYSARGLELVPAVERRMRRWLQDQDRLRRIKGAQHSYSLAEYGLDPDEIEDLFESYSAFNTAGVRAPDVASDAA